ncbi:hypothetical protein [Streptomyces vastus]|uniref:GNAT family N-acetyltransferase n=1 Tax=Streptomyces vastus TaxID=285451 RepID=A0ABN3QRX4_9ACTN
MTIIDERAAPERLHADFEAAHLTALWTQREPFVPGECRITLVRG